MNTPFLYYERPFLAKTTDRTPFSLVGWIAPYEALPWWAGIAYHDVERNRSLFAPLIANWLIALAFLVALTLRRPILVYWVVKGENLTRVKNFEGRAYRVGIENAFLRSKNHDLEQRVVAAESALKVTLHDNLLLRSEPCNLRRNDA